MRVRIPKDSTEVYVPSANENIQLWYENLCHQNKRHIQLLKENKIITSINDGEKYCEDCILPDKLSKN